MDSKIPFSTNKKSKEFVKEFRNKIELWKQAINDKLSDLYIQGKIETFNTFYLTELTKFLNETIDTVDMNKDFENILKDLNEKTNIYLDKLVKKFGLKGYFAPYISPENLLAFLTLSTPYLNDLTVDLKDRILKELSLRALRGDTLFEIQKDLSKELEGFKSVFKTTETRAKVIARNEISKAYSYGSWLTVQEIGRHFKNAKKVWHANYDERTRPSHLEADGQTVDWDEPFIVGGEKLMYPGDPNGSPENVINCRCWMSIVIPEEEE